MEVIMKKKAFFTSRNITFLAVLLALVIVLQIFGGYIKIGPVNFTLTLVPIVLGAVMLGPLAGLILGFAFGLVTLINGVVGNDVFTFYLFSQQPVFTTVLCFVKAIAAGLAASYAYRLIVKKNQYAAVFTAAIVAPVVNTGLFILGGLMMSGTIAGFMQSVGNTASVVYFLIIGCAGINFLVELGLNLVAAPALYRVSGLCIKSPAAEDTDENPLSEPRKIG